MGLAKGSNVAVSVRLILYAPEMRLWCHRLLALRIKIAGP